jgi:hypothetical protein
VDQGLCATVLAMTDLEREHAEQAETERPYAQIRERAKPLAVARGRNPDIPTAAQLRSYLAMLASNRGRQFAPTSSCAT